MKILLVGNGGREHALAWQLAQSEKCVALYAAPGNAGISECTDCIDIKADDLDGLVKFAIEKDIDLVVIGPEAPLVAGLADLLRAKNIAVFGPDKAAAQLEGSKAFMKDLCQKHNIKTAAYRKFSKLEDALDFLKGQRAPIVVKADGLAAGKGVIVAQTIDEAKEAATDMLSGNRFGDAGHSIVIEEFLDGEELSFFAICDGKTAIPFSSAQDHKRAFDGDEGPNTGGMGAYAPARLMTPDLENRVMRDMIQPTLDGMAADGCPFIGVLFAGLMVVKDNIYLLEYNIRFGDPECQALMKLFDGDLLDVLHAASQGSLDVSKKQIFWRRGVAMCVVMAANGYPGDYQIGNVIGNLNPAEQSGDVKIFHAGTNQNPDGRIVSIGGRVLGVTGFGDNIQAARKASYDALEIIDWPEGFYRSDIGHRAL